MHQRTRPTILAPTRYYLPAYSAGGPIRTLCALAEKLGGEFQFKIVTSCRDLHEPAPFPGILPDTWHQVGAAQVLYLSPQRNGTRGVLDALRATPHDILYLNSMFDPAFTLAPLLARRCGWLPERPVILAPRGELGSGALTQKSTKKMGFLRAAWLLKLYDRVHWHASTGAEKQEIEAAASAVLKLTAPSIHVARNLASLDCQRAAAAPPKQAGSLRTVFLSRISPKKNLHYAIDLIASLPESVSLDIYGAIDDAAYWQRCQEAIRRAGCTGRIFYRGAIPHERVVESLARYDAFLLPTLNENFGHVILEALLAGCPAVISDRTPWRNLQHLHTGWDIPLETPARFIAALQTLAGMDEAAMRPMRDQARRFARSVLDDEQAVVANRRLFNSVLQPANEQLKPFIQNPQSPILNLKSEI